jgi:carbon monoxide dehydrogenase subunit G
MEMKGEQLIPASQQAVWNGLNDPQVLRACVPGCESITPSGDNEYQVLMVARVGPVSAKFKGKLTLSDIKPPHSYAIAFEGQGGPAGFAKGGAKVALSTQGITTRLAYDVKASVGGKLAQIGSRLIDAAAKKVADDFFRNFSERMSAAEADPEQTVVSHHKKMDHGKDASHDDGDEGHHAAPIPRDPDLPDVSPTTLAFFAAGSLVVFVVALVSLFG